LVVASTAASEPDLRLITLDPGHFHAALFQKDMLPGVSARVQVYAPLGPDLLAHLGRVAQFNNRCDAPTRWQLQVYAGPDYWERLLAEARGDVLVLSGRNCGKIERIEALARRGFHVLADKPWVIEPGGLPQLEAALDAAERRGVVALDCMTQRFEISCLLQRELVNDPDILGACLTGSEAEPAVWMESVHYLLKEVAGVPNLRPAWFFDIRQQGEGLADVGTHLVDLVQWTLFAEQAIDWHGQVQVLQGCRWPTRLRLAQFQRVTGEREFPAFLTEALRDGQLEYIANTRVHYTLRGVHVRLEVRWEYEAAPGARDTEGAVFRGTKSTVRVRQGREEAFVPEVEVAPSQPGLRAGLARALDRRVKALQGAYPGLAMTERDGHFRLVIPDRYRLGHEAHFGLLTRRFLEYVRSPRSLPTWEKPNMLAKYFVTTRGIGLARQARANRSSSPAPAGEGRGEGDAQVMRDE
jgi:predicted dehydrogenase